jgi:NhaA family Na+:H+ antiporter
VSIVRSERASAGVLLGAAILGLVLANTPAGAALIHLQHVSFGPPGTSLSVGHWISDGLLAVFFFIVAVELKHELVAGELNSLHKALHPAIAAIGGVLAPAIVYVIFTRSTGFADGWPIPTATDIAFALGVLAVFGRGLPNRLRVFLLALAVLDDLIAIIIIAVFFTSNPDFADLAGAALTTAAFGLLSRQARGRRKAPVVVAMVLLGVLTWWLVHDSGVHATIAGVALGLVMSRGPAAKTAHVLEPWSNMLILPIFAFSAALVAIPQVSIAELSAPFWAILIALPVGKLIGITAGGWIGGRIGPRERRTRMELPNLLTVALLGGIGFTVSLLMNELAFADAQEVRDQGTLAVLIGSGISMIAAGIAVSIRSRRYRARFPHDR